MKSDIPKVLSNVLFKPMLGWVIEAAKKSNINNVCIVKGFKHEQVQEYIDSLDTKCESVIQSERRGTAHAVMMAKEFLVKYSGGDVLILGGDSPFIDNNTIINSYRAHKEQNNSATIVSSELDDPFGYGRIVRDKMSNGVISIAEEKDATDEERKIREINSGAYWFKVDDLLSKLFEISDNTSQNEYYLTSIVEIFLREGLKVNAFKAESTDVVLGANDTIQLERLNTIAKNRVIDELVNNSVCIPYRDGVIIGNDVIIHRGATILPNTMILGKSVICEGAKIGPNSQVINSKIGKGTIFNSSYCENTVVSEFQNIKPFTCINKGSDNFTI